MAPSGRGRRVESRPVFFQTEPNCSGGYKPHKHRWSAVDKRRLQQAGATRRSKHNLTLFTLSAQTSIVLAPACHMTPGHSLLITVALDLSDPTGTNAVTHAHVQWGTCCPRDLRGEPSFKKKSKKDYLRSRGSVSLAPARWPPAERR